MDHLQSLVLAIFYNILDASILFQYYHYSRPNFYWYFHLNQQMYALDLDLKCLNKL